MRLKKCYSLFFNCVEGVALAIVLSLMGAPGWVALAFGLGVMLVEGLGDRLREIRDRLDK